MKSFRAFRAGMALAALGCVALRAQYPGHVDTQQKAAATSTLRSVAVLEWTGDRNHPNATRLVPISLFDGTHLQDAALYLARPVPLALDSGTEYEVESTGLPQGWFDIDGARQVGDDWFGFGNWKPYLPPPPKKLHPSRYPPTVVHDKNDNPDKPHFVRRDQTTQSGSTTGTPAAGSPPAEQSSGNAQASSAPVDPDRPKLRRRPEDSPSQQQAPAPTPESPSAAPDGDRPHLSRGVPADLKNQAKPLELTPVAMGQTIAVSDADRMGTQSFAYDWASPEDAASAKKELEAQAVQLLAASAHTKDASATADTTPKRRSTTTRSAPHAKATPADPEALLADVQFHAFALTYGSGATLVLTANEVSGTRSIAMIALQDIYGKIRVLWHSTTDEQHLDITPRMKLVDAVDPRGDGRANLLFEERNDTDRRFALYAVGADNAEQVFATDPLPLHPTAAPHGE